MRCPSAVLLIALTSMSAAHVTAASVRGSNSSSSSSGSGAVEVILPVCHSTSAAAAISIGASGAASCYDTTAFAFANVSARLDQQYAQEICRSPSCRLVYEAAATRAPASDCLLSNGALLWEDVLDVLTPFCNQTIAMAANGSSSGSSNDSDYFVGGNASSGSQDPTVYVPTHAADAAHATTIATIVSIAVGSLLAFVVVVVAVVWYKRQSLRDLRRHAYADPLVEQKPRLGGGIFNANFASRMRFQRSSQGSRTATSDSSSGEGGVVNVVPLRPLQQSFHGDTLWSDQELLARHMRAEDIEDIRVIGNGGHGVVYLVRHRGSRLLASKRLVQDHVTREKTRLLIAEIKLVAKLEHPCIVQFVGAAWTTESDLQALFEYMPNGDLCTHLAKTSQPDEREPWDLVKIKIAMDIAEALVYVHSFAPPLVHRDLKSRNVLLDENMRAKLTDFGVSRFYSTNNTMTTGIGTSRWLAPEVIAGGGTYDQSCDIYSLGIVISELDTHRLPFAGLRMPSGNPMPEMSILQLVSQGRLQPAFRDSCPESLRAIALRCVAFNPKDRPSAIEVSYVLRTIAKKEFGM